MRHLSKIFIACLITAGIFVPVSSAQSFTKQNFVTDDVARHQDKLSNIIPISEARQQAAHKFVSDMGKDAIGFLSNDKLSSGQKKDSFEKLLNHKFDMDTISRFALGRNWKTATPDQRKEYKKLVNDMIVDVYSTRFNDYQGQSFAVKSSKPTGKRDYLVSSLIVPAQGSKVKVDWRVRDKNGQLKIIDVVVEGVSMTLTQRSEFSSVIQRGGGNVDALIAHLKKK